MFAIEHKKHVIRWPIFYSDWSNRPIKYQETIINVHYFGNIILTKQILLITTNLNTDIGIANNTTGTCHSVILTNNYEIRYLRDKINSQPIESIIRLSRMLISISIELFKEEIKKQVWKRKFLIKNKVVVALIHGKRITVKK